MGWIIAALGLGIFLNMSTAGGNSWPIGSVVAVVIMGVFIKMNQDKHFKELKDILKEKENAQEKTNIPVDGDGTHEAS